MPYQEFTSILVSGTPICLKWQPRNRFYARHCSAKAVREFTGLVNDKAVARGGGRRAPLAEPGGTSFRAPEFARTAGNREGCRHTNLEVTFPTIRLCARQGD